MISTDFKPYVLEIINFLRSVSIKYSWIADQDNVMLVQNGYDVDLDDPTTWRYYLNLYGEYHAADTVMMVASLDTLEQIPFTKEVLALHPRTLASYRPGTTFFKNLCAEYPTQTSLIKSILFPVDSVESAIAAKDLTLLSWGDGYLEDSESSVLIADLVKFLSVYVERWYFSFLSAEDYFHPTNLGILQAQMAAYLLARRKFYIHSPYVHSWHISNYLQSKGLDDYSDVLSRKKQMFLYQNYDYLKVNSGKQSNLIILIQNLLSDMGVSLFGRRVVLESQTGAADCQLTPLFVPDNLLGQDSKLIDEIQAESVLEMQQRLYAMGVTPAEDTETVAKLTRTLGDTTRNNYLTKLLEIKPVQVDYRYQGLLDQFIFDTLIKAITTGRYTATVQITDPLTGNNYWVTTKQALALYDYSVRMASGQTPDNIPTQYTYIATLQDKPGTPNPTFFCDGYTYSTRSCINTSAFLGYWTWPLSITSSAAFSSLLSEYWLLYLVKFQNLEYASASVTRQAIKTCLKAAFEYGNTDTFTLIPGFTTYAQWLSGAGIDFQSNVFNAYDAASVPTDQYGALADSILSALFTADETVRKYGNFTLSDSGYTRLRKLFVQLSSYTVRFLDTNQSAQDYTYIGAFTHNDLDTSIVDDTPWYNGLTIIEKTTENCIETSMVLDNTVSLSESTSEKSGVAFDTAEFKPDLQETVDSVECPPLMHVAIRGALQTQDVRSPMRMGFDFSGFAP